MISRMHHRLIKFSVPLVLANFRDMVLQEYRDLPEGQIRRLAMTGVVHSNSARLTIPASIAKQLGLKTTGKVRIRHGDNRVRTHETSSDIFLEIQGRSGVYTAIIEPRRKDVLIGVVVLEDLDFLVDDSNRRLVPRDPRFVISEIE